MEVKNMAFGDFASFKYGKMPNKKLLNENGKYPVFSGYRYVGRCDDYNTEPDTLVVVARGVGGTGDVKLTKEKCYLTNLSIGVTVHNSCVMSEYLYYYFLLNNLRWLDSGSAQSQITISDLAKVILPIPDMASQKKIVSMLQTIDEKIEENERINKNLRKLRAVRRWKKSGTQGACSLAATVSDRCIGRQPDSERPQGLERSTAELTMAA